jgi:DNA-binding MarR family transcriptional regulator
MSVTVKRPEDDIAALFAARLADIDETAVKIYLAILDSGGAHRTAQSRLFHSLGTRRTQGRFAVLRALYFAEGGSLTQREIRHDVRISAPNVSQLLDAMEREGLVTRQVSRKDRRYTHVSLTPAGRHLAEVVVPATAELMTASLEGFSEEEKALFHEFLIRFRINVESAPIPKQRIEEERAPVREVAQTLP